MSATVAVTVVNKKTGDVSTATATCDDNQRITAQLGEVLPKGQYKVVVKVSDEGGVSGNDEASYNVKMLAAPMPPVAPHLFGDITSTDREGQSVPGKFDPNGHEGVAIPGERLTRDGETTLVLEVRRGGETAVTKDVSDVLDEVLDPDGTQVYFEGGQLYGLMQIGEFCLQNGDVMTATFTNALGSTTATGEVYNLP